MFISLVSHDLDNELYVNTDHIVAIRRRASEGDYTTLECVAFKYGENSSIRVRNPPGYIISLIEGKPLP